MIHFTFYFGCSLHNQQVNSNVFKHLPPKTLSWPFWPRRPCHQLKCPSHQRARGQFSSSSIVTCSKQIFFILEGTAHLFDPAADRPGDCPPLTAVSAPAPAPPRPPPLRRQHPPQVFLIKQNNWPVQHHQINTDINAPSRSPHRGCCCCHYQAPQPIWRVAQQQGFRYHRNHYRPASH